MVPSRETAHFDPQPWDEGDEKLPGVCERGGYFLRNGKGEKWVVGGRVVRPLARREETGGKFGVYEVRDSSLFSSSMKDFPMLRFETTHHALYIVDGTFSLTVDGKTSLATANETVFVPAGVAWKVEAESRYAHCYVFANGGGIGEVLTGVGESHKEPGLPDEVVPWDGGAAAKVKNLEKELGFVVV